MFKFNMMHNLLESEIEDDIIYINKKVDVLLILIGF